MSIAFFTIDFDAITFDQINAAPEGGTFTGDWTFTNPISAPELLADLVNADEGLFDVIIVNPTTPPVLPYPFNYIWLANLSSHLSFGIETIAFLSDIPSTPAQPWLTMDPFILNPGGVSAATTIWLQTGDTRPSYGPDQMALLSDIPTFAGYLNLTPMFGNPGDVDTIWQELGQPRPGYGAEQLARIVDLPMVGWISNLTSLLSNPGGLTSIWQQGVEPRPRYGVSGQLALFSDIVDPAFIDLLPFLSNPGGSASLWQFDAEARPRYGNSGQIALYSDIVVPSFVDLGSYALNPGGAASIWQMGVQPRPRYGNSGQIALFSDIVTPTFIDLASFVSNPGGLTSLWQMGVETRPRYGNSGQLALFTDITSPSFIDLAAFALNPGGATSLWQNDAELRPRYGNSGQIALFSDVVIANFIDLAPYASNPGGATSLWQAGVETRPRYGNSGQIALFSDLEFLNLVSLVSNPGDANTIWQQTGQPRPGYGSTEQLALLSDVTASAVVNTNPILNNLVVYASSTISPASIKTADAPATIGQTLIANSTSATVGYFRARPNSDSAGNVSIQSLPGADLGYSTVMFNGFNTGAGNVTRYNAGKAAWRSGVNQTGANDLFFIDYFGVSAVPIMTINQMDGLIMSAFGFSSIRYNLLSSATNPGGATTIWLQTAQPRPGYGSAEQLALLSDVTSTTVVNTNPILNNLVVYGSSTATPASIKTADAAATISQTLIANSTSATVGYFRARPNSDAGGNISIQSLPGADLGYSTVMFNGFNTGAGGVTRYNAGKAAWRVGVDQTGANDRYFIDLFTASAFPVMTINQSDRIMTAAAGFSSIRFDLISSVTNPGGATTIWQQTAQPRPGYGTIEQLALLSDVTSTTVINTNPIVNNLVVYGSSNVTPTSIKTADAPATIGQTLIANSTTATMGYFRARPNSDAGGNISIQSLPGADLGYSSVMFNGFNSGAGGVTRYNSGKVAWRSGVDQTGVNDLYFIDLFTVSAFPVMTINQSDRLVTAAAGFSAIRYDLVSNGANPGSATTIWLQVAQPRPGYGNTEQLALLSDITSTTVINTNPILNNLVVYGSSTVSPASIKTADSPATIGQTLIANSSTSTTGYFRARPNSDAAGNISIQSLPGVDLGYSTVMFNGFNTGAGGVTRYNSGKAAWRSGVDQTGGNDLYFIDLFTVSAFPVMTIDQSDRLITAAAGFSSTRYDLVSSLANPGGATTIWLETGQPRPGYGTTEQLALLSDVTAGGVVVNTNPILNQFVIYNSSGPGTSIKSADAPASIDQTIIANMPLATQGGVRVRPNSDAAGNIFLQSLPGADLGYSTVMFNGFNIGAGGVTLYNAGKAAWRVGVDQTGANDLYFIDLFAVSAFPVMTINQSDRLITAAVGFSSIRYDLVSSLANPGGAATIWLQTGQPRPGYGSTEQLALLSDVTGAGSVVNTNPVLNQFVIYNSSGPGTSIKSADAPASIDQTIIANMPLATQGGIRVRPNSDVAGNIFLQSLPGADLGYSTVMFNGFNTGAGGVTRYNAGKAAWRSGVDQTGVNDLYFIDFFTVSAFPVMTINQSDRLISAIVGFSSVRYDLVTTATNPGGSTTIWLQTAQPRPSYGSTEQLALLSDVTSATVINTNPILNNLVVYGSSTVTPASIKTADAPATISQTLIANSTTATSGYFRARPNSDIGGNVTIQSLPGADLGFSSINYNGFDTSPGVVTRYNTGKSAWRVGVNQTVASDQFFIDLFTATQFGVMTINQSDRLITAIVGFSSIRYDLISSAVNPGGATTMWLETGQPRPGFGNTEQLALLSDITSTTVINTNPILNNLVVYGSSTVTPASIKTADAPATISQTLIANSNTATSGYFRARPNSDIAGNITIQSLPAADLGFSSINYNGIDTSPTAVTRFDATKAAWRVGVDQTGVNDQFFIDLFTATQFGVMTINQSDQLVTAVVGFSSIRYDLISSSSNPGGATTIWLQTAQPRPGYGTAEQLALLSDVTSTTVINTNPILNNLVVYGSGTATPASIKTADAPATISQTLIANSTTATTGYFRARPNSDAAGNVSIQSLPGADLGYSTVMFNGFNTGAGGVSRYNAAKAAWRSGVDQTGVNDLFFIDFFTVSAFPVMTINQSDRLITAVVGFSSIRFDLLDSGVNPGGASTIWLQTAQPRPSYGSGQQLALLSDVTSTTVFNTNPVLNELVVYGSSTVTPASIKTADAPATIQQTLIANSTTATTGYFRARPNSDVAGNITIQSLPGADLGFSSINYNGFDTSQVAVTRYNTGKASWRVGINQTGATDQFFIDLFTATQFGVMTINQTDRLITAIVGYSSTRYDVSQLASDPGGATTLWADTTGIVRYGAADRVLATSLAAVTNAIPVYSDVNGHVTTAATLTNATLARPIAVTAGTISGSNLLMATFQSSVSGVGRAVVGIFNTSASNSSAAFYLGKPFSSGSLTWEFGVDSAVNNGDNFYIRHDSIATTPLSINVSDTLLYTSGATVTVAQFNNTAADNTVIISTTNAGSNRGSVSFGKVGTRWLVGTDTTAAGLDDFFVSKFGSGVFAITIASTDYLVNAANGFKSIRYDVVSSASVPGGGAQTIWADSTTGNSLHYGSGAVLVNAAPTTINAIPVYNALGGQVDSVSSSTAATLLRPLSITGPTGAGLNLISATMDANNGGAVKGPNITIFNTNASNDRSFIQMGKSAGDGFEFGVDYNFNQTKDFYLFRTGAGGGRVFYITNTAGTLQRVLQVDSGVSTLRYDIVTTTVNPGGTNTLWFNSAADATHPRFGAGVVALLSDVTTVTPVTTSYSLSPGVNFTGSGTITLTTMPPSINLLGSLSFATITRSAGATVSIIDFIEAPAFPASAGTSAQYITVNKTSVGPIPALVYISGGTLFIDLMTNSLAVGASITMVSAKPLSVLFST